MKAIQFSRFGGPEVLDYVDVPTPVPVDDEVLIEVTAAGVNYVDIRERLGVYHSSAAHVDSGLTLPRISGLQGVGVVRDVGTQGDQSLIGKRVMALLTRGGGYAQFAIAPSKLAIPLSSSVQDAEMAALPTQGLTAYFSLTASTELRLGESVLVHGGSGGVGSMAIQIARLLGAGLVIATASTDEKRAFARRMGADKAIAYDSPDWPKAVLQHTDGRGVDIILESIGGDIFEQNFECLAPFGRHIVYGSTRGPGKPFEPRRLMQKSQTLAGIYLPVFFSNLGRVHDALRLLADHAATGQIKTQVAAVLPLREAGEAHRRLEERRVAGALVLDPH